MCSGSTCVDGNVASSICAYTTCGLFLYLFLCGLKAPEVFMGRSYSEKVDVYSYAICLAGKPLGIYICTWTSPSITELSSLGTMSRVDDRARSLPGHGATGLRRAGRRRFSLFLSLSLLHHHPLLSLLAFFPGHPFLSLLTIH